MTYLAPRQGLFAIIILISFFIQTMLLLISTNQQLDELKMQTGQRMLVQLIEEVKLPLLSKDKVSLSVLTGRYTSENNVASLTVKDIDGEVLLQTGQAQLLEGDSISREVVLSDTVIGEVVMTLRDTNNGEIIASQWIFILGSFITHIFIWLIYGYIARPTKAQLAALSRDVQDYIRLNQNWGEDQDRNDYEAIEESTVDDEDTRSSGRLNVQQTLSKFIKSNQQESNSQASEYNNDDSADGYNSADDYDKTHSNASDNDFDNHPEGLSSTSSPNYSSNIENGSPRQSNTESNNPDSNSISQADNQTSGHVSHDTSGATTPVSSKKNGLVSNRPLTVACVQIRFYDPDHLLSTLAFEKSKPYFALCTQLLQRTLDELLKQPLLFGVKVINQPIFDENGITVELTSSNSSTHSKAGLAAMMLAKSFVMLNEVTFLKHRELQRFALEVVVGVSDIATVDNMKQLINNNAKANDILTLLPSDGIKQLRGYIQLDNLKHPTTVYERDCASLKGVSDSMMQRLTEVRNAVLLSSIN